ncbi:uncharacterized protein LOC142528445 [Primulina tabacum]|uniref:uncharacterized protein LOC142528445 n=1 Tax=Primulina tabacum TaxID=48773 RepID=UPI003F5A595A
MAENRENDRHVQPEAIPIRDHFRPVINNHYSGIARGTINANNFELKPALINMVQQNQFARTTTSDPHVHLRTFLEITDTVKINNVPDDTIRLRLFPFSLRDQAREWLQSLPFGSITTWQELATKFLAKYFPPAKSAQLKIEISTFRLTDFEQLYEAWERDNRLLLKNCKFLKRCSTSPTRTLEAMEDIENVLNPPPGFNTSNGEGKPSFEDLVGTFVSESGKRMSRTESRLDNLETHMASIGATLKILESQVGQITKQLTSQPSGAVQKTAEPNLREVNAIFIQHEEIGVVSREEKVDQPTPSKGSRGKKGLEDLKNLQSNIQSVEQEEVAFTEEDDKGRQGGFPQKLQDPGEFVVPCEIGGQLVEKAICDSGASVNIMPSFLYEKLGLSRIKPTGLSLQMADKSVRTPLGIVEDVELKIDKIRLLADFVVLDMGKSQNVRAILGRPFLATAGAVIDLRQGKLTMAVDGQNIELKASKISYDPP